MADKPTGKLLDELDALMQRMLALPVREDAGENEPKETIEKKLPPAPAPIPITRAVGPRSVQLRLAPAAAATDQTAPPIQPPPVVIAGKIPAFWPAPKDTKSAMETEPARANTVPPPTARPVLPVLLTHPKAASEKLQPLLPPVPQRSSESKGKAPLPSLPNAESSPAPRPVWLQTPAVTVPPTEPAGSMRGLLLVNRIFDLCTYLLGPIGRWLRAEQGRALIGLCGLAMLAGAVIWAVILFRG